jgi:hypothetical protein
MLQDILQAVRQLRLTPRFSIIAICVIALGIGANTAMFSIIDAVILKPLPYAHPERLVMLWETRPDRGFQNNFRLRVSVPVHTSGEQINPNLHPARSR